MAVQAAPVDGTCWHSYRAAVKGGEEAPQPVGTPGRSGGAEQPVVAHRDPRQAVNPDRAPMSRLTNRRHAPETGQQRH